MCLICPLDESPKDPSPKDPSPKDPSPKDPSHYRIAVQISSYEAKIEVTANELKHSHLVAKLVWFTFPSMGAPNFHFSALESPVKSVNYENQEKLEKNDFFSDFIFFIKIAKLF